MKTASEGYEEFGRARFFGSLDGLRCLSIVAVMVYHAVGEHGVGLTGKGYLGVALFFAISGFLITTLLLREQASTGTVDLKRFYIRRSLRIFPLYYAVLGVYTLLVWVLERHTPEGEAFFRNLPAFLTYTSNWFVPPEGQSGRVIFVFAWSLATEEQFYLVWPWVVRRGRGGWGPVAFMLGVLGVRLGVSWAEKAGHMPAEWLLSRVVMSVAPSICLGCLAAYVLHWRRGFEWAWGLLGQRWSAPLALGLTLVTVWVPDMPHLLQALCMVLLVVACCIREDHGLAGPLRLRPVAWVGVVSYGLYLLHMLVLNVVRRVLPWEEPWVVCLGMLVVSVAVASVSYRFFETPFLRLKERFAWEQRPAERAPGLATGATG